MANVAITNNYKKALGLGGALTAVGGGIQTGSIVGQGYATGNYYDGVARHYMLQQELNKQITANQINYDSQSAAYRIRSVMSKGEQLFAKQKTALARGGDSTGATARAIVKDSARKQAEDIAMIQYQNELSAFERNRQMLLENISLNTNAKMAELSADNARTSGLINGVASFLSTAGTLAGYWYTK